MHCRVHGMQRCAPARPPAAAAAARCGGRACALGRTPRGAPQRHPPPVKTGAGGKPVGSRGAPPPCQPHARARRLPRAPARGPAERCAPPAWPAPSRAAPCPPAAHRWLRHAEGRGRREGSPPGCRRLPAPVAPPAARSARPGAALACLYLVDQAVHILLRVGHVLHRPHQLLQGRRVQGDAAGLELLLQPHPRGPQLVLHGCGGAAGRLLGGRPLWRPGRGCGVLDARGALRSAIQGGWGRWRSSFCRLPAWRAPERIGRW